MRWKVAGAVAVLLVLGVSAGWGWRWLAWHSTPDYFAARAEKALRAGDTDRALSDLQRALWAARDDTVKVRILTRAAEVALASPPAPLKQALSRFQSALRAWWTILQLQPDHRQAAERFLEASFEAAKVDGTREAWTNAQMAADAMLAIAPTHPLALRCRALAAAGLLAGSDPESSGLERVRGQLEVARAAAPDDPELAYALAQTYLRQAALARTAAAAGPTCEDFCRQAGELLDDLLTRNASDLRTRLAAARVLLDRASLLDDGESARRARELLQVPEADLAGSADSATWLAFAVFLPESEARSTPAGPAPRQSVALARSEALIRAALAARPDDLEPWLALAGNLAAQERLAEAAAAYTRVRAPKAVPVGVVALNVHRQRILATIGQARLLLRRLDESEDGSLREPLLAQVRELAGEIASMAGGASASLDLLQGRLAYYDGRYREAAVQIEFALRRFGSVDADALLTAGLALARVGETGGAGDRLAAYLKGSATTRAGRQRAATELARLMLRLERLDQALELTEQLVGIAPQDSEVLLLRSQALLADASRGREASDTGDCPARIGPLLAPLIEAGNGEAVRLLARAHVVAQDTEAARRVLSRHLQSVPDDASTVVALVQAERAAGRADEAGRILAGVAERAPATPASRLLAEELRTSPPVPTRLDRLAALALERDAFQRDLGLYALWIGEGQQTAAAEALSRAALAAPASPVLWRIRIGQALFDREPRRAEELLAQAGTCGVCAHEAEHWRAQVELAHGRLSAAQARLEKLIEVCPLYSDCRVTLGDLYMRGAQSKRAETQYVEALKLKPDHQDALLRMFRVCDLRGRHEEALTFLREALVYSPSDALMSQYLRYADLYSKETALAVRQKLAAGRSDTDNRRAIARLFAELDEPRRAAQVLDELIAEEGRTTANVLASARVSARVQRPEDGQRAFVEHLEGLGTKAQAADWLAYARFLRETGRPDAEAAYQRAMELSPAGSAAVAREFGNYYAHERRHEQALSLLREALLREPRADTWRQVVASLVALGRYGEAEKELAALKGHYEADLRVALLEVGAALGQGDYGKARQAAEQAVLLGSGEPAAYLARAHVSLSSPDEQVRALARDDLDRVLETSPNSPLAREMLVRWLLDRGATSEAIVQLEELVQKHPRSLSYRLELASLYLREQRLAVLEEQLGRWSAESPDAAEWRWVRGNLLLAQGRAAAACAELATYVEQHRTVVTLDVYARALMAAGRAAEALALLDGNAAMLADSPVLLAARAAALARLGRRVEGRSEFAKAVAASSVKSSPGEIRAILNAIQLSLEPGDAEPLLGDLKERTGDADAWLSWVSALIRLGREADAGEGLQGYSRAHSPSGRSALLESELAAARGDRVGALAAIATAVRLDPKDAGAYLHRARLVWSDPTPEAQAQVKRDLDLALSLDPTLAVAQDLRLDWLEQRGRSAEATEELRRLIRVQPDAARYRQRLAQFHLRTGGLAALEDALAEWSRQSSGAADLHRIRGWLLGARADWAQAALEFAACHATQPSRLALSECADAWLRAGKADQALAALEREAGLVQADPGLKAVQARALAAAGRQSDALRALQEAFRLATAPGSDPAPALAAAKEVLPGESLLAFLGDAATDDPTGQIRYALAQEMQQRGNLAGAVRLLEALRDGTRRADGRWVAVRLALASAYSGNRQHDQAEMLLRAVLKERPGDPAVLNALAYELADGVGKAEEALRLAAEAVRLAAGDTGGRLPHYLDTLGLAQYLAGRYDEARRTLERALAMQDFAACRIHLAQVAQAQGDHQAALKDLLVAAALAEKAGDADALAKAKELREELGRP